MSQHVFWGPVLGCVILSPSLSLVPQDDEGALKQSRPRSLGKCKAGICSQGPDPPGQHPEPIAPYTWPRSQDVRLPSLQPGLVRMGWGSRPARGDGQRGSMKVHKDPLSGTRKLPSKPLRHAHSQPVSTPCCTSSVHSHCFPGHHGHRVGTEREEQTRKSALRAQDHPGIPTHAPSTQNIIYVLGKV